MDHGILGILIGTLCGAAIGVERQWSGHATGPASHFAGIRTLTLLGGLSGAIGFLWLAGFPALATALLAGAVGIVVIAYAAVSQRDLDATTEVASLVVVASGVLAGLGMWTLASGITAIAALLLIEKSRLHTLVSGLPDTGIRAGFRFAIMALVVLPLLPKGPFGPLGGIRPRELWVLVLFFSGLSFAAYILRSIAGPGRGYVIAGLLGGLISSTNVTLTFARASRGERQSRISLALGVLAACTMMYVRVNLTAGVLNPQLGLALAPYMLAPALAGAGFVLLWERKRAPDEEYREEQPANPLQLRAAIQMVILFQIVRYLFTAVRGRWGQPGMILSGAILGFTDMDALVISLAQAAGEHDEMRAVVVAAVAGTLSNTALKTGIAAVLGEGRFRALTVSGLVGLAAISLAALFLVR